MPHTYIDVLLYGTYRFEFIQFTASCGELTLAEGVQVAYGDGRKDELSRVHVADLCTHGVTVELYDQLRHLPRQHPCIPQ